MAWFEIQRSPQMQVEECRDATEWEPFKVREGSNAKEAVEAAADGELGCYRARREEDAGPFPFYCRVTGDGICNPEE
jgi:hypothetical protein